MEACIPFQGSLPADCCSIITPLNAGVWETLLASHPDKSFVDFLVRGLRNGFRTGCRCKEVDLRSSSSNMSAAELNPEVVNRYIKEEVSCHRLFEVNSLGAVSVHVSKLGVIPKKHQPGKWRMIVDLSSPSGASVNDFIDPALCSLKYASVDDAAEFVAKVGPGALLAKLDIKSAYRNIPVHPGDRHLLGIRWQGRTYVDSCLPFGLRSAPKIFNATADALEWMIAHRGGRCVEFIIHYLDDFLFGGGSGSDSCANSLAVALQVCREVGFPIMKEKVVEATTLIEFLGFLIDTRAMEIRLPLEKLRRVKAMLHAWKWRKSCTKRELLSMIGTLQHASTVVKPGRTFLRRMIDLSKRNVHLDSHMRLNMEFRADLRWWATFIDSWNGVSVLSSLCRRPIDAKLVSDASGSWGCGAYFGNMWFSLPWSLCPVWTNTHISVKELLPIVIACAIWGREMAESHIRAVCDNAAVVVMINKRTSSNSAAMHLLRCLYFICSKFHITLTSEHVAGTLNKAADALSRDNVEGFLQEVSSASSTPSAISSSLMEILIHRRPNWLSAEWSAAFQSCF